MSDTDQLDATTRKEMLQRMLEIRIAEEEIQNLFLQNLIRGTTHLVIGQEACSVGVAWALQKGDSVTCTYRGHGYALALGMSLRSLMAEMMGRESGCCKGRGGSMHMTDATIGLLGANAIVGAQLPIAVGAGLTYQVLGSDSIAVTAMGDGATNIGAFHESLNMAAIWKLPVLFIIENNLYGEYTPLHKTTPVKDLAVRAQSYNMPGVILDGQDVEAVHVGVRSAVERARKGDGPTLLELKTYRFRGHSRTDSAPYRQPGELEAWLERDPIDILRKRMLAAEQLREEEYAEMKADVERKVHDAIEWAKAEPYPPVAALDENVFFQPQVIEAGVQ